HRLKPYGDFFFHEIFSIIVGLGVVFTVGKSAWAKYTLLCSWLCLMALFVFKYEGNIRHCGFLCVLAVYAIWISKTSAASAAETSAIAQRLRMRLSVFRFCRLAVFSIAAAYSLAAGSGRWIKETTRRFSDSKDTASFIVANHLDGIPIAVYPSVYG